MMSANSPLHIVILAAGKGTRMYSALPKVLHEIGAKPMLAHVIAAAQSLEPEAVHVVVGHGKEWVRERLRDCAVNWVEQNEQLGTGHAVKMVLPHLPAEGRTLVLYGDVPLINSGTLKALLAAAGSEVGLLTDVPDNPAGYGRIVREDGRVVGIVEEKDADAAQKAITEINTGILVLPNPYLAAWLNELKSNNAQGEYYLTDLIALACRDGVAVHPLQVAASYLAAGVNNKLQLAQLERIYQANQAQALLAAGVTLRDPARFDLRGTLKHGQDVVIDVGCVFEGDNVLGDNVHIGAHCVIKNAQIGSGTRIAAFSHLEDCRIGENAQIGPFARLRPHAELGNEVHIGNFVEVKNSVMADGSKANHLSYLGDADIGARTNIGAGTITANYDGVNKYRTHIGSDVRIGSDCVLVAPVRVGDKATTGAGSVITKDCPDGQLVVARARQTVIAGWKRPEKPPKA